MNENQPIEMIFTLEPECLQDDTGEICMKVRDKKELVRCRDCKYATLTYDGLCKYCEMLSPDEPAYFCADFFCAYGERSAETND